MKTKLFIVLSLMAFIFIGCDKDDEKVLPEEQEQEQKQDDEEKEEVEYSNEVIGVILVLLSIIGILGYGRAGNFIKSFAFSRRKSLLADPDPGCRP